MPPLDWLHVVIGSADGEISLLQMCARAVIVFVVGIALIRVTTARIFSSQATPLDIILSVIIGSNLSRTLTGNAPFEEVIVVTVLLVALHAAVARVAASWRPLANLVKGKPTVLIEDGAVDEQAMKRAAVGTRDLKAAIRAAGGTDIDEVKLATMERGGDIDVVLRD